MKGGVASGYSSDVAKNRKLGQVTLDDLPPGPAGSARVELVITVNVESILSVTAREIRSGREASVTIRPSGGLSQREIVEIITRRRHEHAALSAPEPAPTGGGVRVTTRDHMVAPADPTAPPSAEPDPEPDPEPS